MQNRELPPRIVICLLLMGSIVGCHQRGGRTLDDFSFIDDSTSINELFSIVGEPDRDVGSGLFVFEYRLSDDSSVFVGTADRQRIIYVRHGDDVLYGQD